VPTRRTPARRTSARAAAKSSARILEISFGDNYEEPRGEYMGEDPRPGVYRFKLQQVGEHRNRADTNTTLRWIFNCIDEPYAGWGGFLYTDIDPASEFFYKTQHTTRAVMGGTPKNAVKLNLDNPEPFLKAAKVVLGRVVNEENRSTGEVRPSLSRVAPDDPNVTTGGALADDDDYDDEDDEYTEDLEGDEDADETDEEDGDDEGDEDEYDDEEGDEDDEEGDEEDEDEPEPEPEPAPKRRSSRTAKTAPAKKAAPAKSTRRARR
jgi:hypothetical protein